MQWTGLNELREKYLSFFESKGHLRLDSFPLVPKNDPSLLLINSGMAPMKKWFLAQEEPPRHRVTTCQKCIRTPDIERVGITARHGTFFEMLGNFSFQDYFKEEVIPWAWEFLTSDEWMAIPKDRLHISVYEEDDEAYDIWTKKVGIAPDHMVRLGKEDNFWEHGSGPCGPCSEIYFDRGPEYGCGKPTCGVGCDCDRYMEIWNLVFSQFDADGKGHYERLARPNIDTGMGLERLACVMQNVGNLFEVDTVQSVLHHVEHIAGKTYKQDPKTDISIRVITDHIRSCTFMVSDGILPSNEGRGYVLRRLLRRAARHGRMLGIDHPFLVDLVETVIQSSESAYPELREHDAYIKKVIGTEEANFARTIDAGMNILNNMIDGLEKAHQHLLKGLDVFKLNDTFGFPLDLTKEIAAEQGIEIDEDGFHAEMKKQKERARAERLKKNISGWSEDLFGALDAEPTVFTGYETLNDTGVVVALSDEETLTDAIATDEEAKDGVLVVLDKTPFYAEMGGQAADHGMLNSADCSLRVLDVKKTPKGYYVHTCVLESGIVKVGDHLNAQVDKEYRMSVCRNHTATHLLQAALPEKGVAVVGIDRDLARGRHRRQHIRAVRYRYAHAGDEHAPIRPLGVDDVLAAGHGPGEGARVDLPVPLQGTFACQAAHALVLVVCGNRAHGDWRQGVRGGCVHVLDVGCMQCPARPHVVRHAHAGPQLAGVPGLGDGGRQQVGAVGLAVVAAGAAHLQVRPVGTGLPGPGALAPFGIDPGHVEFHMGAALGGFPGRAWVIQAVARLCPRMFPAQAPALPGPLHHMAQHGALQTIDQT